MLPYLIKVYIVIQTASYTRRVSLLFPRDMCTRFLCDSQKMYHTIYEMITFHMENHNNVLALTKR